MTQLFVQYSRHVLNDHRENVEYGSWGRDEDFTVTGVSLSDSPYNQLIESVTVDVDIAYADVVHVLWMTYSSGDSFGTARGIGEILWVFKDEEIAWEAYRKWESDNDQQSVEFQVDGGKTIKLNNPAWGTLNTWSA